MPNDFISREAAQYKIREQNINPEAQYGRGLSEAIDFLQGIPAADVVPVVHGEWTTGYFQDIVCTRCLHPSTTNKQTDYCPHCGAKMDLTKENHDI